MIRILLFFVVLIVLAFGEAWLVDRPGHLVLNWQGYRIETSVLVGIGAVFVAAAALVALWTLIRFIFKLPSLMVIATQGHRREKGYAALSRGMVAVGAGDAYVARKASAEAQKLLRNEPLALLLEAQAAQLSGETGAAEAAFKEMTKRNDMRLLGLRGLYVEAQRRGESEKARQYAEEAAELKEGLTGQGIEERNFIVRLEGGPLDLGKQVIVKCHLSNIPATDPLAATATARIDRGERQVAFVCHVEGFLLLSVPKITVDIKRDGNTDVVPFLLEVSDAEGHRITVTAYQNGIIRGQVVIDDPPSYLPIPDYRLGIMSPIEPASLEAPKALGEWRRPNHIPSISLDLISPAANIVANSPRDKLNWNAQTLSDWRSAPDQVLEMVREHVKGLYSNDRDVEDEFVNALGPLISRAMPKELVEALTDPRVTDLMIQVPANFDYPIELATVAPPNGVAMLVQDRMATARWFVNSCALHMAHVHSVSKVAYVLGQMNRPPSDGKAIFNAIEPTTVEEVTTKHDLFEKVFAQDSFNLFHYYGHSGGGESKGPDAGRFLSLAKDRDTIRLIDVGRPDHGAFFSRSPLIMLNCCDAAGITLLLGGKDSFPHRFVQSSAVACIAPLWPVDSAAAHRFAAFFYDYAAKGQFLHTAVKLARQDLINFSKSDRSLSRHERRAYCLAARAYVFYGPPDLKLSFMKRAA
jgi:HemY protein N-terminus/CHAT domain